MFSTGEVSSIQSAYLTLFASWLQFHMKCGWLEWWYPNTGIATVFFIIKKVSLKCPHDSVLLAIFNLLCLATSYYLYLIKSPIFKADTLTIAVTCGPDASKEYIKKKNL